jgi:hypothetical protein
VRERLSRKPDRFHRQRCFPNQAEPCSSAAEDEDPEDGWEPGMCSLRVARRDGAWRVIEDLEMKGYG